MVKINKKNKQIKVWSDNNTYTSWLDDRFAVSNMWKEDADIIMFTGGPDVNPSMYGEDIGKWTAYDPARDTRDEAQWELSRRPVRNFSLGICRGAQYLCVKAGGRLFQDVTGHAMAGSHPISIKHKYIGLIDKDIQVAVSYNLTITSTHHQMMNPYELKEGDDYEIIGWAEDSLSIWYLDGDNKGYILPYEDKEFVEPEIVYFPKTRSLAIQGHPERMVNGTKTVKFLNDLLYKKYMESL